VVVVKQDVWRGLPTVSAQIKKYLEGFQNFGGKGLSSPPAVTPLPGGTIHLKKERLNLFHILLMKILVSIYSKTWIKRKVLP